MQTVTIEVNGEPSEIQIAPRVTLADALRDQLDLTGTHLGCEQGVCGACTVLLEGEPVRSCLMFAVQADGLRVTTIEGLKDAEDHLHPLQEAFLKHRALQCGFCTPGFLVGLLWLVNSRKTVTRDEVQSYVAGHICRCTGYLPIIDAACDVLERVGRLRVPGGENDS